LPKFSAWIARAAVYVRSKNWK